MIEAKKAWGLSHEDKEAVLQGYGYALYNGARYVLTSNGDYYAVFDRFRGLSISENFVGEFRLTELNEKSTHLVDLLRKRNVERSFDIKDILSTFIDSLKLADSR